MASLRWLKIQTAAKNTGKVLLMPAYATTAVVGMFVVMGVILWSLNLDVLRFVVFESGISTYDKFTFFISVYRGIFSAFGNLQALSIIVFSILFGINLALLCFVLLRQRSRKALTGSSVAGLGAAILGGGCIACGTSVLTPLLTSLGVLGATALTSSLGVILNIVGSILIMWSLYKLGLLVGTILAKQAQAS